MRILNLFTALALLSFCVGRSSAEPASSVPVACMTYPLSTGSTISFGVPVLDLPAVTGFASSVSPNTIGTSDVSWNPNQFVTGGVYFVTIRTGAQAGRTLLVLGNTANTLTLDVEDTPLDSAGFAVTQGTDTFELFRGDSLSTLFGGTADANGFLSSGLKGGTSTKNADNVQLFDGTNAVTYFFNTTLGTWILNGTNTDQNGLILYPDDGMLVVRRGPTGNLTMLGRVPSIRLLTKIPGGTTNVTAIRFPVDTTLGALNFGAPGSWITGPNSTAADTVSIWTGSRWDTYFKNLSNQWLKANGNGGDQSGVVLRGGSSIRITKRGSATDSAAYLGQQLPYSF
jgi:uncharacterized protein (TIGR02597 family)